MNTQSTFTPESIYCSIDPVVFSLFQNKLHVLLIQRIEDPYKNRWALPGGLISPSLDEQLTDSVNRVLKNKSGAEVNYVEQLMTLAGYRDPRGFSLSVAYIALVAKQNVLPNAKWVAIDDLEEHKLAFDHLEIIIEGVKRLTSKVSYSTLPMHFLEKNFTLPQLQKVYEILLNDKLDKSTFRKKIEETGHLIETGEMLKQGAVRPAKLYCVKQDNLFHFDKSIN